MILDKRFKFPIFDFSSRIVIFSNRLEAANHHKSVGLERPVLEYGEGSYYTCNDGIFTIALLNNKDLTQGVIAHECKHLINAIFHYIGHELCTENDELECYFLTYIVNKVNKQLVKHGKLQQSKEDSKGTS